jgi:hypothetical protein
MKHDSSRELLTILAGMKDVDLPVWLDQLAMRMERVGMAKRIGQRWRLTDLGRAVIEQRTAASH